MKALFLGSGYVGNYFRFLYPYSIHTSRKKENILKLGGGIVFDSNDQGTWRNISKLKAEAIIISFPLTECNSAEELWKFLRQLCDRVLVIGTTSGFSNELKEVSDNSPIEKNNPRSLLEEGYRKNGASIICPAGIYGKNRNPIDWLRKGLIKNQAGTVNLIHAEDLARACAFIVENFTEGERFVLSDNQPYTRTEIIKFAVKKGYIIDPGISSAGEAVSRAVKPEKLFQMGFVLKHPSLFEEIVRLETEINN